MCMSCRTRYSQGALIRLKLSGTKIVISDGQGRSFYLCTQCVNNPKRVRGLVKRFKQDEEQFTKLLTRLASSINTCESLYQFKELMKNG